MRFHRLSQLSSVILLCVALVGCHGASEATKEQVTLTIKTPPIGLGVVPGVGEAEAYDLFVAASEKFSAQYDKYDVAFQISRYDYLDEQEQLVDRYGTEESVDIFYSGSWNTPTYAARGWLVPLNDIVDKELRADIDEAVWEQYSIDGQIHTMPFQQLQNTLMVNRTMMEDAGLEEYIPEDDSVAHWSTEEFKTILRGLKSSLSEDIRFPFMMYAANSQGDSHIMTLLRSHGGTLYDGNGNFAVNTPEGIAALRWIKEMDEREFTPKGAENMELLDCVNLFYNGQLAICVGNLTNLWDAWNRGLDVFAANFPSPNGNGYCTSSVNGFCIFDNGDEERIQVAKDFIRFIYTDDELMRYTLGTLPVNHSVVRRYGDEIRMVQAYGDNTSNLVDNVQNNLGWQGVRDVFYSNIQNLLLGHRTPEEVAADIDESCNAALENGGRELN